MARTFHKDCNSCFGQHAEVVVTAHSCWRGKGASRCAPFAKFVIWLLSILLLMACQQAPIAPVPLTAANTTTRVPPSVTLPVQVATAVPTASPTATPVPPTPTPVPTGTPIPTPATRVVTTDGGYTVTFEPSACPIEIPESYVYECGTLIVPGGPVDTGGPPSSPAGPHSQEHEHRPSTRSPDLSDGRRGRQPT